ncbi:MAG: hypothetical protein KF883_09125 [Thermomicrobiales bacterium]|nr:hypothetical protein [Thermomicrobiales bacterium]
MTSRIPRSALIMMALAIALLSLPGVSLAQPDDQDAAAPSTTRSSETTILTDTFDSQETGVVPPFESDSDDISVEYDGGEFDIDALAADFQGALAIPFGDIFTDLTVAIDVTFTAGTGDQPGRYAFLTCRTDNAVGGYRLEFRPLTSSVIIRKLSGGAGEQIAAGSFNSDEPYTGVARMELTCQGSTIAGRINGIELVSVQDSDFTEGHLDLGGGVYAISNGRVSVNFDNLAVSVPNALAPTPTPQPSPTFAPSPAPEPTSTPSPSPTAEPSSTAEPSPTMEPTIEPTPTIDRSAIMAPIDELRNEATANDPIFGPSDGAITQVVGGSLDAQYSRVAVANFRTVITFENPTGTAADRWDLGLGFRQTANGQHWRIIIRSDGTWSLAIAAEFPRATGAISNLDRSAGGANTIELIADGAAGYLLINDEFVAMLDLTALQDTGDIWAGSGFFLDFATQDAVTPYTGFTIWGIGGATSQPQIGAGQAAQAETTPTAAAPQDPAAQSTSESEEAASTSESEGTTPIPEATAISSPEVSPVAEIDGEAVLEELRVQVADQDPVFGPESGDVVQGVGSIDIESSGVSVEDFYTSVRFTNPASATDPDHPWDVLIGFWHEGGDEQVRVVVASDGTWSAAQGTARPTVSGEATSIDLGPARGNVIELAVVDGTGYLAINGEFVAAFAAPGAPQPGDIWIASGTFPENVQPGEKTLFSDWSVWSLDEGPAG